MKELRFLAFIFSMEQRLKKVLHEKKSNKVKKDLILKKHEFPSESIKLLLIKLFHDWENLLVRLYAGSKKC